MNLKAGRVLYFTLIGIFAAVFIGCGIYIGMYFYEGQKQQAEFDNLALLVDSARGETASPDADTDTDRAGHIFYRAEDSESGETIELAESDILPEYLAVYELNNDMVGWLSIEGTNVNYPVMQSPYEDDYYLKRNFNKEKSSRGCLYVREECNVFAPSDNLIIYGHNMRDGSMFGTLMNYRSQSYWKNHDTIIFDTLTEHHTYKIFAVFTTTATVGKGFSYHQFVDAANEDEFNEFVNTCKELALYDTGITPEYGDKLICLSTCEYSQTNGRLVVMAVRVS